jgi:hypothetical protein
MAFFTQNTHSYRYSAEKWIITFVFEKNDNFRQNNCEITKIAIITLAPDHVRSI